MSSSKLEAAIDALLVARLEATDATAGTLPHDETLLLFDGCAPSLLRYVKSIGLDAEAARDVVQETFLALYRHLSLDRPRDNLKGWLFKVGHNLALKHRLKTRRREADAVHMLDLAELLIDPSLNPEQRLAEEQRCERLRAVMEALPERDRQCLCLRWEGLRYRDISEVLGISLGSVAKSVARSLERLADV